LAVLRLAKLLHYKRKFEGAAMMLDRIDAILIAIIVVSLALALGNL